jgi:hypothetical protein
MGWVHSMNERVADSIIGRYFELKGRKTTFSTGTDQLLEHMHGLIGHVAQHHSRDPA